MYNSVLPTYKPTMDGTKLELLKSLSKEKRLLVVLVKWRYPFYTQLENFQKPDDVALIGCFGKQLEGKMTEQYRKHFDIIDYFDWQYSDIFEFMFDANSTEIPELQSVLSQIVDNVHSHKLRLIETEEFLIHYDCALRQKLQIPGPTNAQLEQIRDKQLIKIHAKAQNIATAKFYVVDFTTKESDLADKIDREIGDYPMFAKPVHGVGASGAGKIKDREELDIWIQENQHTDMTYLVEEFLEGREFWVLVILEPSGTHTVTFITYLPYKSSLHATLTADVGSPMFMFNESYQSGFPTFPNIQKFVDRVIEAFHPPHPHAFGIQGYQMREGVDDYRLTELAFRINGARGTMNSYRCSGVSNETALLMCHMDNNYKTTVDPDYEAVTCVALWYPKVCGILKETECEPGRTMESKFEILWFLESGTLMETAKSLADFICAIHLTHPDKDIVIREGQWLRDHWKPTVI